MAILESLKTSLEIIISGSAIIFTIYKLIFRKWYRNYKEHLKLEKEALFSELHAQNAQIKLIKDKLYPNGGSSIDDKVEKVMKKLSNVELGLNSLQVGQRNTWDILDIASWESDNEGKVNYVSAAFCDLLDCTPDEVMGNSWIGKIAYFDRDKVLKLWKEAIDNASEFTFPYNIKRGDGRYQKVAPIVIHNKDEHGVVLNSLGRLLKVGEPYNI